MLKVSHFLGQTERGISAIPLFGKADAELEKCASSGLLPEVVSYIESLRPSPNSQYVLVNAMGAVEYYGSNINGDAFTVDSLIHKPDNWTGNPLIDKISAKSWPYGFPTFYNAHPFAHHRNKDASRAFGNVELATWNDNMKRVELVVRVDKDKCIKFGGQGVWDKLRAGQYPDVSMGTKVPFDTCSICLDWALYREALATYKPGQHTHPGQAALAFHKRLLAKGGKGIRGLSVTRKDYCQHALREMSRIYPDGRKVWVWNDFPRFFDISFVFIGADKTAKVMLFIVRNGKVHGVKPSAAVAEEVGADDPDEQEKTGSVDDEMLKVAFGKLAKPKRAEINKDVTPSYFAGKAVPVMTKNEPDIPKKTLDGMGKLPMDKVLSTTAGMGMVLKPREFQRVSLVRLGRKDLADDLDDRGVVFPRSGCTDPIDMGRDSFLPSLMKVLLPLMALRSALGPVVERRVVILAAKPGGKTAPKAEESELLDKIGAAYNGYRSQVIDLVAHAPELMQLGQEEELSKVASAEVEELFTPLSVAYLKNAYMDEFGVTDSGVVQLSHGHLAAWRGDPP